MSDQECDGCGASVLSLRHFQGCPLDRQPEPTTEAGRRLAQAKAEADIDRARLGVHSVDVGLPVWKEDEPPLTPEEWAERRMGVARRWTAVARFYGKPASAYEVTAAVGHDAVAFETDHLDGCEYDRRALLNVISVLLDAQAEQVDPGVTIGPIHHSNQMCQKTGCECWCQACERHNWRHERALDVLRRWGFDQHEPFCVPSRECTCRHQVYAELVR